MNAALLASQASNPVTPCLSFQQIGSFNLRTKKISVVSNNTNYVRDSVGVSYNGYKNRYIANEFENGDLTRRMLGYKTPRA